jgi:TPR repeat protein
MGAGSIKGEQTMIRGRLSRIFNALVAILLVAGCTTTPPETAPSPSIAEALRYLNGDGVPRDEARGVTLLRPAAEQGNREAQFLLALAYQSGKGVAADDAAAVRWLERAAQNGQNEAQYLLGLRYMRGKGVAADPAQAADWLQKSAEQGNAGAQYNLGLAYAGGKGVARDDATALRWLERAAAQGHPEAQYATGSMYQTGRGTPENRAWATRWFGKAAAQNVADAQYMLGMVRAAGSGISRDLGKAYFWLDLAARHGVKKAAPIRDRIGPRLGGVVVRRVKGAEAAWKPLSLEADRTRLDDPPTIMFVQYVLNRLGYKSGPVDGIIGPRTRGALTAYRSAAKLGGNGIDEAVLTSLKRDSTAMR